MITYSFFEKGRTVILIYAIQLDQEVAQQQYDLMLSKIAKEKQKGIQRYVSRKDALRSLVADILIRWIIITNYHIPNQQIQFEKNPYGKPYIKGLQRFHFNVSHSGHWVVAITDRQPVGIDIEQILPIDFQLVNHSFSRTEIDDFDQKKEEDKLSYFYDLWSLKESYIKMTGRGLSIPLNSFTCRIINKQCLFLSSYEQKPVYFKQYEIDSNYRLSVCQQHSQFVEHMQQIPLETLIDNTKYFDHLN